MDLLRWSKRWSIESAETGGDGEASLPVHDQTQVPMSAQIPQRIKDLLHGDLGEQIRQLFNSTTRRLGNGVEHAIRQRRMRLHRQSILLEEYRFVHVTVLRER